MILSVDDNGDHPGHGRYALTETAQNHLWGECVAVDGFFGEPQRGMYELFGWVSEGIEVRDWAGSRLWLVPDGEGLESWLLEDAYYLRLLEANVAHPRVSDLIYHPPAGMGEASAEQIIDTALSYRPIAL
jgi:hypothetical protein